MKTKFISVLCCQEFPPDSNKAAVIPIPILRSEISNIKSFKEIDIKIREAFNLKTSEWLLFDDLCNVTLEDFKNTDGSPGRQRTLRISKSTEEPQLQRYCENFIRVLKAGFGQDKNINATIFHETNKNVLPFRLIAFELNKSTNKQIRIEPLKSTELLEELESLNQRWLKGRQIKEGSIFYHRVARIYDNRNGIPTIFILKPDAYRYWTASMGLHDADEVALDFTLWRTTFDHDIGQK